MRINPAPSTLRFERNAEEVDAELRREFRLPKRELELNEGQKQLVDGCKALETLVDESGWKEIESNSAFVSFAVKNVVVECGKHRCAPPPPPTPLQPHKI